MNSLARAIRERIKSAVSLIDVSSLQSEDAELDNDSKLSVMPSSLTAEQTKLIDKKWGAFTNGRKKRNSQ